MDSPTPQPGEGEVVLRVQLAGVCTTDRHIVSAHFAVRPPRILGHELVGRVVATGNGVDPAWNGKLCGVRPARFCGKCAQCRNGAPQLCQNFECLGNTHDGGYAEYTLVRKDQLVTLEMISPEDAVLLEPLACVIQALSKIGGGDIVDPVLIIGAGVMGKLMIQVLRATTSAPVAILDPNSAKVAAALRFGAQIGWTVSRQGPAPEVGKALIEWAPHGVPTIVDTTGSPIALQRSLEWARPGGKILLFGVSEPSASLRVSPYQIFTKELTILASSGMTPTSFDSSVALLKSGRIDPHLLIAIRIDLTELPAYLLGSLPNPDGKVVVSPQLRLEETL